MESPKADSSKRADQAKLRESILKKAFDVYDTDGSGTIDHEELRKLFQDLGWPMHDEFLERAVRVLDADMSGGIDFPEFLKWTEFAYASRILYRSEMMPITPRRSALFSTFLKGENMLENCIKKMTSLDTVHEHKEISSGTLNSDSDEGEDEDEDEDEDDFEGVREPSITEFVAGQGEDQTERVRVWIEKPVDGNEFVNELSTCDMHFDVNEPISGKSETSRSACKLPGFELCGARRQERKSFGRVRFQGDEMASIKSRGCGSSSEDEELAKSQISAHGSKALDDKEGSSREEVESCHEEKETCLRAKGSEESVNKEVWTGCGDEADDEDGTEFGMPVKRMATMVLGRPKFGHLLTSTARSQSMINVRSRDMYRMLGARTESKMTVRMRWACGQFRNESEEDEEECESSNSEGESDLQKRPEWPDRQRGCLGEVEAGFGDTWEANDVGNVLRRGSQVMVFRKTTDDLRRVRSE